MIKYIFYIKDYWKVIVYYNIDYNLFNDIRKELKHINISDKSISSIYNKMYNGYAKAVTISNIDEYTSVILFNHHKTIYDYMSSIVHESEHIKQHILKKYKINDIGEPPAYTIGFIAMNILKIFIDYDIK